MVRCVNEKEAKREYDNRYRARTRDYQRKRAKRWYWQNHERAKASNRARYARHKEIYKANRQKVYETQKLQVLYHYSQGTMQCAHCGFSDLRALTLDHVNNDGAEHRRHYGQSSNSIYRWLIDNNFPEGFQVLCWNCNWIKRVEANRQ